MMKKQLIALLVAVFARHACPVRNNGVKTVRSHTGAGGCATHRTKQRTRRRVSFSILF